MRILQLHCDSIDYTPTKQESIVAEEIKDTRTRHLEEIVVAFVAVEAGDDSAVAADAIRQINESMLKIGCTSLLIYPYAHLSSDLAKPSIAFEICKEMEQNAIDAKLEVSRAPFGWTKSYQVKVKGHPLAESSKAIKPKAERGIADESEDPCDTSQALKRESKIESQWRILTTDGDLVKIDEFDFTDYKKLEMLAKYEIKKQRQVDEPPPHVALMKKLTIADYEPASDQGNMRFFPNGRLIKSLIETHVTNRVKNYGGYEVETPIMYDSQHPSMASYFNRFPARQYTIDSEGKHLFLRFAACFGQFLIANHYQMSHHNLPYRLYEMTRYSFRREQSGELVGLRRLRAFTMPDCHAFCRDLHQAVGEIETRFELSRQVLSEIGITPNDYEMAIRFTEEFYHENRNVINKLATAHGRPMLVEMWKDRFFYFILKWEFNYIDNLGKASSLSTDQIDVENAGRYGITFVDEKNRQMNPIILHNSPSGAIERVIYTLLEKAACEAKEGKRPHLPLWISPTQVRIIPLTEEFDKYAESACKKLSENDIRADIDDRNMSIGKRIREAEKEWTPYILVVGAKEAESDNLRVRDREAGDVKDMTLDALIMTIREKTAKMPTAEINMPVRISKRPQLMI